MSAQALIYSFVDCLIAPVLPSPENEPPAFTELQSMPLFPMVPAFPAWPMDPRHMAGGRPMPAFAPSSPGLPSMANQPMMMPSQPMMMPSQPMMGNQPMMMPRPLGPTMPMQPMQPMQPAKPFSIPAPLIMGMMMPMTAVLAGTGPRHGEPDPFAAVNVVNMMKAAVPDDASTEEKALAYGNIIAGMGGVKGLRGSTLKRLQGSTQSLMYGGERFLKSGVWGDTS